MDNSDTRRRGKSRLRQRQASRRKRRDGSMAVPMVGMPDDYKQRSSLPVSIPIGAIREALYPVEMFFRDIWWHIANNPLVLRVVLGFTGIIILFYFLTHLLSGSVMPGVRSMGVDLGGMSTDQAVEALTAAWGEEIEIALIVNGESYNAVRPASMGIHFDAIATAEEAKSARLGALPFGKVIKPVVTIDRLAAQTFILDTADLVDKPPYNAGYTLDGAEIVGIRGQVGYMVDVALTLESLLQNLSDVVNQRRLDLIMIQLEPDGLDPNLYMDAVYQLVGEDRNPTLRGYDPYSNQHVTWEIPLTEYLAWLAVSYDGLTLREAEFRPYLNELISTINEPDTPLRYLAGDETSNALRRAIVAGNTDDVVFRIRYRDTTYRVQGGDTGYAIGRKNGVPFDVVEEFNPTIDLTTLVPGDEIRIPSRDITMPETPIDNKRIIVDLDNQYLVAYEDNQIVFEWKISSGVANAPTSPGIFQILSHNEKAYGGSINYCDDVTLVCGQWEMDWFMGIYEVIPGLLNGFHGSVLLPNGLTLGDSYLGTPITFGCVMSSDDQAKLLYDWAETGTVVEIISFEYKPYSDLAKITKERLDEIRQQEEQAETETST